MRVKALRACEVQQGDTIISLGKKHKVLSIITQGSTIRFVYATASGLRDLERPETGLVYVEER